MSRWVDTKHETQPEAQFSFHFAFFNLMLRDCDSIIFNLLYLSIYIHIPAYSIPPSISKPYRALHENERLSGIVRGKNGV